MFPINKKKNLYLLCHRANTRFSLQPKIVKEIKPKVVFFMKNQNSSQSVQR
jgi:hypothetical protein